MKVQIVTVEKLLCPYCEKGQFEIEHIRKGQSFGPWYCDDCGRSFRGKRDDVGMIELESTPDRKFATVDVLMLPPQTQPVYFIVAGMRFAAHDDSAIDEAERKQYFYDEHSCPINWLKPVMVYSGGDSDPHGLIQFVRYVDAASLPPDQHYGPNDRDFAMIALIEQAIKESA